MRTTNVWKVAALAVMVSVAVGCGGSRQTSTSGFGSSSPFGDVYEAPCSGTDTDEYFWATGIASGSRNRMDVLQTSALTNAQNIVRQKMQHAYKGAIDDYSSYMGNNLGSDAKAKVERAGTQLIDVVLNDTKAACGPKFSGVDEKGEVTCYVGIKVDKKAFVEQVSNYISKDEELKMRYDEEKFREKMDANFEKYKSDRK